MGRTTPDLDDRAGLLLDVVDLHVSYGASTALHGVDLTAPSGEVTALLGPNGAGKSTLARAICGTLSFHGARVRHGAVRLCGSDITRAPAHHPPRIGIRQVFEGRRTFASLSVRDNLFSGCLATSYRERHRRVDGVLELFPDLRDRLETPAATLSGGQQQMVAIGRALMGAPRLLVLDEPSLGLAPLLVEAIGTAITQIVRSGIGVLLIDQNAGLAASIADRVVVLRDGVVVATLAGEEADAETLASRYLDAGAARPSARLARPDDRPASRLEVKSGGLDG